MVRVTKQLLTVNIYMTFFLSVYKGFRCFCTSYINGIMYVRVRVSYILILLFLCCSKKYLL